MSWQERRKTKAVQALVRENRSQYARNVVFPIGTYRFLTPLDTVQDGDLFRIQSAGFYLSSWSPVRMCDTSAVGRNIADILETHPTAEYIRPIEGDYVQLIEDTE